MELRKEPWPALEEGYYHPSMPCPVCGQLFRPWAGSYLPCHARCLMTEEEQDAMLYSNKSNKQLSQELGVTLSVIRASINQARQRADKRRRSDSPR